MGERSDTDGGAQDTTLAVLSCTSDGLFAGAVMPMRAPLDSKSQWQGLVDGLLGHVIGENPETHIDGLYAFTWWSDPESPNDRGLMMTRLTNDTISYEPAYIPMAEGLLGLMLVSSEERTLSRYATLGLRGYATEAGKARPDRIIFSVLNTLGVPLTDDVAPRQRKMMKDTGKILIDMIDESVVFPHNR